MIISGYDIKIDSNFWNIIKKKYAEKNILPLYEKIFKACELTSLVDVKVVLLGQDPYPNKIDACGLSFSVERKNNLPKSLKNMFQELENDLGIKRIDGDLTDWAKQGVLLLNYTLTVEEGLSESHSKLGWDIVSNDIIKKINNEKENVIFILLGNKAQKLEYLIDEKKHIIIKTSHPSPLSVYRGFKGSKIFSKTNKNLKDMKGKEIKW